MKPIERTIASLHMMYKDGPRYIMGRYGESGDSTCTLNDPLPESEIINFIKEDSFFLPEDYKKFLTLHNGGRLFSTEVDTKIELFTLQEMLEFSEEQQAEDGILEDENYWIIGQQNEYWILIDKLKCQESEGLFKKSYIIMLHPSDGMETAYPLNMNFESFLECAVIAQGDNFWNWHEDSVMYHDVDHYDEMEVEM